MNVQKFVQGVFEQLEFKPQDIVYLKNDTMEPIQYIVVGVVLIDAGIMYQLVTPHGEVFTVYPYLITHNKPLDI